MRLGSSTPPHREESKSTVTYKKNKYVTVLDLNLRHVKVIPFCLMDKFFTLKDKLTIRITS
jgi:hypothetical protein